MAFNGTKTPTLKEINRKPKYEVKRGKFGKILLTPEQEADIIARLPVCFTRTIMREYGISFCFLQNFKRKHGLVKDMKVVKKKHAQHIKQKCERNGYYDSIRGKRPSEACLEGSRKLRATGFHPLKALRENNPRRYKRLMEKRVQKCRVTRAKDRRYRELGLGPQTGYHIPTYKFSKDQIYCRYMARKLGYIMGNMKEEYGERYTFYYTEQTQRSAYYEASWGKHGFTVKQKIEKVDITNNN